MVFSSYAQFVKKNGQLKLAGTQLVNQNSEPIVLRGMSLGWHCYHPRFYTKGTVDWLVNDWNCNVVRAALGVEQSDSSYIKAPDYGFKKIETVIQAAIANNIYVIVDWHSHNLNQDEAIDFFSKISKKYGKYPNIIYEICNEPDDESWESVKIYAVKVINAIRANDPANIIIVGSPHWDQDLHLVADNPIIGYSNIMYSMHFYAGTHSKWLRDRVDYALAKGIPIFVSESAGMEATGDGPLNHEEWRAYIEWMEHHKISWVTWSVSDKDESCSVLHKSASSEGQWKTTDLKESGIKVRAYLRELNANKN